MYNISVIIPIYNVEKYIERCAISLFEQTLQSIEYIFVDDCSPDNSINLLKDILNRYPNRIPDTKILKHKNNRGSAAARNTGRKAAQGKYIIECDSDDWVEKNMYELMYNKAQQNNADIVICDWNEIYSKHTKHIHTNIPDNNINCVVSLLSGQMQGYVWNKLIKRELYNKYKISCTEGINFLEDLSVTYKLFYYAKSISYINKPLYNYFKGNINSYTSKYFNKNIQEGMIKLTKQVDNFFKEQHISDPPIKQAIKYFKMNIKVTLLLNGEINVNLKESNLSLTFKDILSHPTLSSFYKIILFLDYIHFSYAISCLQYLRKFKSIK